MSTSTYASMGRTLRPSICAYSRLATPQDVYALATAHQASTPHGVFQELMVNPKVESRFKTAFAIKEFGLADKQFGMDFSTT